MDSDETSDVGRPILAAAGFQPASRLKAVGFDGVEV
jgi:hypothetical protein